MDVAKYIGLFLLKNQFVYIHGLGNLEIKKKPSKHNGQALSAPSTEVIMSAMGSIDDTLANFIATNEQISISKASNALREFSMQARAELHKGQKVLIPGVGSFVEEKGRTIFNTDPSFSFTPPAIPLVKNSQRLNEIIAKPSEEVAGPKVISDDYGLPAYPDEEPGSSYNWGKIAVWLGVLVAAGALAFFGYKYVSNQNATTELPLIIDKDSLAKAMTPVVDSLEPVIDSSLQQVDTTTASAPSTPAVSNTNGLLNFDVVINTYDNIEKAQRRTQKLKSYGNDVSLKVANDSSAFYVVMAVRDIAATDTAHRLDSLRRNFNPNGVSIFKP